MASNFNRFHSIHQHKPKTLQEHRLDTRRTQPYSLLSPPGALLLVPGYLEAGLGAQAMDEKDGNNGRCNFSTEDPGEDKAFAASLVDQDQDPDPTDAALLDNECSRVVDQDPPPDAAALLYDECSAAYGAHVAKKNKSEAKTQKFASELKKACVAIGMDLKSVHAVFVDLNSPNKLESTLHDVQELFGGQGVEVNQINLLIVILPEFRRSDAKVKDICKNLGFLYQCCLPEHARTPSKLYLNNVAHNIRSKEKRVNGDSEKVYGSDEMREDSESDLSDLEDMGDADSDIIYLEAFPTSDEEMDDDDDYGDDDEYVPVSPDEEMDDDGSVQQMRENDELCKQLQRLEENDGHEQAANSAEGCLKTYKEIETHTALAGSTYSELSEPPSFEAFLCPGEREHILKTGWETQHPYKKPSGVSWDEYSKVFDTNGYYKLSNMPVEDKDLVAAECNTPEVRRWENHVSHDYDELQEFGTLPKMDVDVPLTSLHIRRTLLDVPKKIDILIVIMADDRSYDGEIEEMCESLRIDYVFCLPCLSKRNLKRVARQIQLKKSQRFFGAHTIHYDLGEDSEAGVDSEGIASQVLSVLLQNDKRKTQEDNLLQCNILHRGGLMEGEMERICLQEIDAIKQACAYSYKEDQPSLTYVVVVPTASIGTEADTAKYKFFCRHTTHKSTSRVVRYHVVHDDNNFLAGELQSLTLKLFTFRHRREYPKIDAVVPAYYAERAAFKAYRAECAAFKASRDKCAASKAS
uniref:Piwi domain-containing protein n=1 Tax=Oryza nivara TaxID=4536 RepID=A0A0E0GJT0_ORYNI